MAINGLSAIKQINTENCISNLAELIQILNVITLFRLIVIQNCVSLNKIQKRFLCVYRRGIFVVVIFVVVIFVVVIFVVVIFDTGYKISIK